jgi:hypothetical protein
LKSTLHTLRRSTPLHTSPPQAHSSALLHPFIHHNTTLRKQIEYQVAKIKVKDKKALTDIKKERKVSSRDKKKIIEREKERKRGREECCQV